MRRGKHIIYFRDNDAVQRWVHVGNPLGDQGLPVLRGRDDHADGQRPLGAEVGKELLHCPSLEFRRHVEGGEAVPVVRGGEDVLDEGGDALEVRAQ